METKKICPRCHIKRFKTEFHVLREIRKDGTRAYKLYCWPCEKVRTTIGRKKANKRNREWLAEYKKTCSCVICGENEPICLDFHHIIPKPGRSNKPSYLVYRIHSLGKLQEKIKECIPLCSNCHRKVHEIVKILCKLACA